MSNNNAPVEQLINAAFDLLTGADNFRPAVAPVDVSVCAVVLDQDLTTQAVVTGTYGPIGGTPISTFTITIPATAVEGQSYVRNGLNLEVKPGQEIAFTTAGGTATETGGLTLWTDSHFEMFTNNVLQIEVTV